MNRSLLRTCLLLALCSTWIRAQTPVHVRPPFTQKDVDLGKELAAKSVEIRAQIIAPSAPAEPFEIMGNLYFAGVNNGEVYLLTSPQGHIMFGVGYAVAAEAVEKNIEKLGFKLTDIKAIVLNHNHGDQSGAADYFKRRTGGAKVMAGFGEIPFIEHGGALPAGAAVPNIPPAPPRGQRQTPNQFQPTGTNQYPPVKVDRALFDGDVVKVGPLSFTAYLMPGHSPSSTSFLYTVKDGGRDYRVFEFCCWEYPDDLSRGAYITEASVRHNLETFRKVLPVDIYLETGAYGWSGTLNQPPNLTIAERMANLRTNNKLFVNRDIFRALSAAREVEFEEKLQKLRP
jgi:glyoxylase-like metal-dependent hydrolase (beta-lactamase superfamily II)